MQLRPHQSRAFAAMQEHNIGQIIVPTGGGKTYIMIADCLHRIAQGQTVVVVAPRILLANQLCEEFMEFVSATWTHVMHVHSGETKHFSTTNSEKIALFNNTARAANESCLIFTTYHSLGRVVDSGINVDSIYFDEAHKVAVVLTLLVCMLCRRLQIVSFTLLQLLALVADPVQCVA